MALRITSALMGQTTREIPCRLSGTPSSAKVSHRTKAQSPCASVRNFDVARGRRFGEGFGQVPFSFTNAYTTSELTKRQRPAVLVNAKQPIRRCCSRENVSWSCRNNHSANNHLIGVNRPGSRSSAICLFASAWLSPIIRTELNRATGLSH